MAMLILSGSVGAGGAKSGIPHNQPEDVAKVRDRFVELGYIWMARSQKQADYICNLIILVRVGSVFKVPKLSEGCAIAEKALW